MDIKIPLLSEQIYSENIDKTILSLIGIANKQPLGIKNQIIEVNSWKTVQSIVRLGLAKQFFKVGDQLQCTHEVYGTGEQKLLTWDIIGIDYDIPVDENGNEIIVKDFNGADINAHSLTIQTHDCLPGVLFVFSKREYDSNQCNVWETCELRKWLNTDAKIDNYHNNQGFLYKLDPSLLDVLGTVAKVTAYSEPYGGKAIVLAEKVFLPSITEVFAGKSGSYNEGSIFLSKDKTPVDSKLYCVKDENNIVTIVTPSADSNPNQNGWYEIKTFYDFYGPDRSDHLNPNFEADSNRVKTQSWWLRSPQLDHQRGVTVVYGGTGSVDYQSYAASNMYVSPACVIV